MNRSISNIINTTKMSRFISNKKKDGEYHREISIKDLDAPITILMGPNGTGKSMSILNMVEEIKSQKDARYVRYSTSRDDIVTTGTGPFNFDPSALAYAYASEGERMIGSFQKWANSKMLEKIMTNKDELYVIIDEADSGLSIDRLMQSLIPLKDIIKMELAKGRKLHFVFTVNSYEMLEVLQSDITEIIWVPTKEKIEIDNYEEFKSLYTYYYDRYYED